MKINPLHRLGEGDFLVIICVKNQFPVCFALRPATGFITYAGKKASSIDISTFSSS